MTAAPLSAVSQATQRRPEDENINALLERYGYEGEIEPDALSIYARGLEPDKYAEDVTIDVSSLFGDPQYRDIDPETGEIIERNYAMGGLVRKYGEGGEVTAGDRLRQFGKGALFGFGDEAEAAVRSVLAGDLLMRNYPTRAAKIRDEMRQYEEAHPYEALAYEAGGMLVPAVIPGGQGASAARLAALAARNPRLTQAGLAVGQGALYGAGTADSVADIPRSMAEEGVLGGVGYGVMGVAGKGLKKGAKAVRRRRRAKKGR